MRPSTLDCESRVHRDDRGVLILATEFLAARRIGRSEIRVIVCRNLRAIRVVNRSCPGAIDLGMPDQVDPFAALKAAVSLPVPTAPRRRRLRRWRANARPAGAGANPRPGRRAATPVERSATSREGPAAPRAARVERCPGGRRGDLRRTGRPTRSRDSPMKRPRREGRGRGKVGGSCCLLSLRQLRSCRVAGVPASLHR